MYISYLMYTNILSNLDPIFFHNVTQIVTFVRSVSQETNVCPTNVYAQELLVFKNITQQKPIDWADKKTQDFKDMLIYKILKETCIQ